MAVYARIAAWFYAQDSPQVIMDGRFAADILRGSTCIGDPRGTLNTNLIVNYFVRGGLGGR